MATARGGTKRRSRSISELQREAPEIVREAGEQDEVEITRYGEPVAYIVSPRARQRAQELDRAADRAVWSIDFQRAMKAAEEGRILDWDEAAKRLRARFIER